MPVPQTAPVAATHTATPSQQRRAADFWIGTGAMTTVGTYDPTTKAVTDGDYPHLAELMRLAGRADLLGDLQQVPRPVVAMVGSSTEQDLEGDVMYPSAIQDMTQADQDLSLWLNHCYTLPEDLYGRMVDAPYTRAQSGITDLHLRGAVETLNPRAVQTYLYTVAGGRMGVSGGFMVLEAEWIDRKTRQPVDERSLTFEDICEGLVSLGIKHVKAVEWSVVGIPANQRSWVESAAKGLFARTGDRLLAPVVRGLYGATWKSILAGVADADTRRELEDVPARRIDTAATARRLFWNPNTDAFLAERRPGHTYALSRRDVAELLTKHSEGDALMPPTAEKAASDEDKTAQEARAKKYHIGIKEGGNVTKPAEFADVPDSAFGDPVNYRYPMKDAAHARNALSRWGDAENRSQYTADEQDIITGRIERRARALGVAVSDDDDDDTEKGVEETDVTKKATTTEPDATKAGKKLEIGEDGSHAAFTGTHTHAHKAFGSQGDDGMHEHEHSHDGDADHHHSHAADDDDEGDEAEKAAGNPDKTAAVTINEDGTHAAMTGSHAHAHKAYGMTTDGAPHSHTHSHHGDANHDHEHGMSGGAGAGAGKEATPEKTAASAGAPADPPTPLDPAKASMLATYNFLGMQLGFAPVGAGGTPDATMTRKAMGEDAAQRAISLVSELDRVTDQLYGAPDALNQTFALSHQLMALFGVPDADDGDEDADGDYDGDGDGDGMSGGEAGPGHTIPAPSATPTYPVYTSASAGSDTERLLRKVLFLAKEGRRHSERDMASLQMIHDEIAHMTEGMACKTYSMQSSTQDQGDETPDEGGDGTSTEDANAELDGQQRPMGANTHNQRTSRAVTADTLKHLSALPDMARQIGDLTRALAGIDVKALETHIADITAKAAATAQSVAALDAQRAVLEEAYERLANVPLPRPTTLNRSVDASDPMAGVATYRDMTRVNSGNRIAEKQQRAELAGQVATLSVEDALALTTVEEIDGITYRRWPAGVVPAGGRPDLSNLQKTFTPSSHLLAYRTGDEAYITIQGEALPVG